MERGERLNQVSNEFGGGATTVHLHFSIRMDIAGFGNVEVDDTAGGDDLPGSTASDTDGATGSVPGGQGMGDESGCGCRGGGRAGTAWWLLAVGLGLSRRRRRLPHQPPIPW